jgi:hypothetical protein
LDQLARRGSDGNHGRDGRNTDDHPQNSESGPKFVLGKSTGSDSERAENVHLFEKNVVCSEAEAIFFDLDLILDAGDAKLPLQRTKISLGFFFLRIEY